MLIILAQLVQRAEVNEIERMLRKKTLTTKINREFMSSSAK